MSGGVVRFESWVWVRPAPADGEPFMTAESYHLTPCPDDAAAKGRPAQSRLNGEAHLTGRAHPDLGPVWRLVGAYRSADQQGQVEITVAPDGRGWAVFRPGAGPPIDQR